MTRLRRWLSAIVAALMAAGLLQGPLQPAEAAAGTPAYCSPQVDKLDNRKFGKDIPVILVHGIQGSSVDWAVGGSGRSFYDTLDSLPYVSVAQAFDYDAEVIDLITPETIHPAAEKLAATIHCASMISKKNGGQGKVIVIGYSLGGLVTRLALSYEAADKNGVAHKVSKMVSQVVTIGTPHRGLKDLATKELVKVLPKFPGNVDVLAIAGDVTQVQVRDGVTEKVKKLNGDGMVPTNSAITGHSKSGTARRMTYVYECRQEYAKGQTPPTVGCEHGQLIKTPSNGLSLMVADIIHTYHGQNNHYGDVSQFTIGNLRLRFEYPWTDAVTMDGAGRGATAYDSTNGVKCTNCDARPTPMVYAFVDVTYHGFCQKASLLECAVGDQVLIGSAPNIKVGGRKPDVSAKYLESGQSADTPGYAWCFSVERVCISYRRGTPGKNLKVSDAFNEMLANATWVK